MIDSWEPLTSAETALLHATSTPEGQLYSRSESWQNVFGQADDPWAYLDNEEQHEIQECLHESSNGSLVTEQLFMIDHPREEEPLPVLLHFIPVPAPKIKNDTTPIQAITITGEVLAEPTHWTKNQTQRHRFETLGRMTMGIAHDFNNLLSGILGYTELLTSAIKEGSDPPVLKHLETIETAALDGAALISKIQEYIRQEKKTRFEAVSLPELIDDCVSLTRPYWYNEPRRQGIHIDVETELNDIPKIMGSPTELREVLVNLTLNAVQALPDGGHITFRTEHRSDQGVLLTVEDDGTGMDEETREQIFDPLFTTKGEEGTGMGLAVSYGIVQEHDGSIDVHSTPGEGTTFVLTFPPAQEAMPSSMQQPDQKADKKTAHILVVDDEAMVRNVLTKLLSLNGHTVQAVSSGSEALSHFQEESYDLVFTDHGMPGMDGRALARALRERRSDLPIVLLTGDTEVEKGGQEINRVIDKPFQIDEIESLIQQLL